MIRKTTKQHFFRRNSKNNPIPTNHAKKINLIPNNLTVMVALIPLVEILEDPYKILI